ncbi:MAG: DUF61 family protein [Asgard group archaeon]|nr:DUF61 family protein [Asgard group archaeon]
MSFDDKLSKYLKYEIDSVNNHLPKKRITLLMAEQGNLYYVNREDAQLYINKKEIQILLELCPKEKHKDVYLPILIIRRRDLGRGTYIISGELIEQFLVSKAINKYKESWENFNNEDHSPSLVYLYKPDLIELRKVLPTSTVIGFA